jgi:hypothetical protein
LGYAGGVVKGSGDGGDAGSGKKPLAGF